MLSESDGPSPTPPHTSDPLPVRVGRFEIRKRCGSGSFGTVYCAYDPRLHREVALKVPKPDTLTEPGARERFLHESKAAAQLRHPHIVPVYDADVEAGLPYIVSAYIKGESMDRVVAGGPLEPRRAAEIILDLAEAAHAAHLLGIIHRDIKPSNVMLDGDGNALLMDFGLARWAQSEETRTHPGNIAGTPCYIAPERASGGFPDDPACDQYSLGVTFYELLCGERPFSGPPHVVLFNAIHREPLPPTHHNPLVPSSLEAICLKTLAKSPADRYPDCQALAEALRHSLNGQDDSIEGVPIQLDVSPRPSTTLASNASRPRSVLIPVLLTAVIASVAAFIALRTSGRPQPRVERESVSATIATGPRSEGPPTKAPQHEGIAVPRPKADPPNGPVSPSGVPGEIRKQEQAPVVTSRETPDLPLRTDVKNGPEPLATLAPGALKEPGSEPIDPGPKPEEVSPEIRRYADQISEAHRLCQEGDAARARDLLDECSEDLRGWEWDFCSRLSGLKSNASGKRRLNARPPGRSREKVSESLVLRHQESVLHAAAFRPRSPFPALLATYGTEQIPFVLVWDTSTGFWDDPFPRGTPVAPQSLYLTPQFSPNGKWVALTTSKVAVEVRDVDSGQVRKTFTGEGEPTRPTCVAISRDSQWLGLSGGTSAVYVYDMESESRMAVLEGHANPVSCLAFSPDRRRLAAGTENGEIVLWDVATQRVLLHDRAGPSPTLTIVFGPNGTSFFEIKGDGTMQLREGNEWKVKRRYRLVGHAGPLFCAVVSPDSRRVVTGSEDKTVKVWETMSGHNLLTLEGHRDTIKGIAFSPNGQSIASVSHDNTIRIWVAPRP